MAAAQVIAQVVTMILAVYGLAGVAFAAAFVAAGIQRVDPAAAHAPIGFRLIVFPGVAALWPLLLGRWMAVRRAG
jgi:hypothetical protein